MTELLAAGSLAAGLLAAGLKETVLTGSLLLAAPIAVAAGLVSFLSPCVLPLVPGYLSYVAGLSGADIAEQADARRGRVALGGLLFVLGFSAVFIAYGALFGGLSGLLFEHQGVIIRVLGVVVIALGLVFMGALGWLPGVNRDVRIRRLPPGGLAGAPVLGVVFGIGWTPCIGPTLGAVITLAASSATAARGALLGVAYCIGLGVPFILTALAFRRALGAFAAVKRHYALVMRVGGGLLVVIGVLQVTGVWESLIIRLQGLISSVSTPI